jgi:cold shock CspA family protein
MEFEMPSGVIKFFDVDKEYGVVQANYDNEEILFHYSEYRNPTSLSAHLQAGDHVTYQVAVTEKGIEAINLQKVSNQSENLSTLIQRRKQ